MPEPSTRAHEIGIVVGATIATAAFRLILAAMLPLMRVETYYWTWSRDLAWSYYDHPPGIAVLLRAIAPLLGDSALGIRLGPWLLTTMGMLAFWMLCRRLVGPRAALWSAVAVGLAPFWGPFGVLAIPDTPLLFCWTLALLLVHAAWSRQSLGAWAAAGACAGLAILSKYTGFLLFPAVLAFLVLGRTRIGAGPCLAAAIALALLAPNLIWNTRHGSSTLLIPFRKGIAPGEALAHVPLFLLLPFLLLTPVLAAAWIRETIVGLRQGAFREDPGFRFLVCASWIPFAAFLPVSFLTLVHAHWPAPCFVAALPLALRALDQRTTDPAVASRQKLGYGGLISGAVLVAAVLVGTAIVVATVRPDPTQYKQRGLARVALEFRGWRELDERLHSELARRAEGGRVFLASMSFHLTSQLEWRLHGQLPAFALRPYLRHQYAVRHEDRDFEGWNALFVEASPIYADEVAHLRASFRSVERLEPIRVAVRGTAVDRFEVYWCEGYGAGR